MRWFEAVRLALRTIRTQKLKSFFSLVGVLIGVMFLIAVVSIVTGMNRYMEDRFANSLIGLNTFMLRQRPAFTTGNVTDDVWRGWMRRPRITYSDADFVQERMRTPVTYAKFCSDRAGVYYGNRVAKDIELIGTEPSYFEIKDYKLTAGRPFSAQEVKAAARVVVIGQVLSDKLLEGVDPIGKEVRIGGIPYRIIGLVEKQGTLFGLSLDKFAIIPFTAPGRRMICPINVLDHLMIQASGPGTMVAAMGEVEALMRTRRHLKPGEENNFYLQTSESALEGWQKISKILITFLPMLVSISLIVGGIVIMNIMLMAVAERTREIGIRKALGARRRDILAQFVVESATLSAFGALLGIGAGILLAFVVRAVTPLPAAIAPWSIVLGVGGGVLVGVVAGVYPANRASKRAPIVALRAE
jgi:putative ABC transport system permease protein